MVTNTEPALIKKTQENVATTPLEDINLALKEVSEPTPNKAPATEQKTPVKAKTAIDVQVWMDESIGLIEGKKPSKHRRYVPNLQAYSKVMGSIIALAKKEHPFAIKFLIEHETQLDELDDALATLNAHLARRMNGTNQYYKLIHYVEQGILKNAQALKAGDYDVCKHILLGLDKSIKLMKQGADQFTLNNEALDNSEPHYQAQYDGEATHFSLKLYSGYGYHLVRSVLQYDVIQKKALSAQMYALLDEAERRVLLKKYTKWFERIIYSPFQIRAQLNEPLSAEDVLKNTKAFQGAQEKLGPIDKKVLSGQIKPRYG